MLEGRNPGIFRDDVDRAFPLQRVERKVDVVYCVKRIGQAGAAEVRVRFERERLHVHLDATVEPALERRDVEIRDDQLLLGDLVIAP